MTRPPLPPDDTVPDPDAEPTPAEKAQARAFGELLDKALAGRTPPAMAADDRDLLEVATIIRAVSHPQELSASRTGAVVEGALRRAAGDAGRPSVSAPDIVPLGRTRTRSIKTPWIVAGATSAIAAAAVIMLIAGVGRHRAPIEQPQAEATARIPDSWRSRPADAVVGKIPANPSIDGAIIESGARIDAIFADRLDGFRERTLAGRVHKKRSP